MVSGIYAIINLLNNKVYIGSATDVRLRWNCHKRYLKLNKHPNSYLQNAWNKYGEDAFEFILIAFIEKPTKQKLEKLEQYWMDRFDSINKKYGYNIRKEASSNFGLKRSNKTKKLMSKVQSQRWSKFKKLNGDFIVSKICRCGKEFSGLRCFMKIKKYCSDVCAHNYYIPWNKGKTLSQSIRKKLSLAHLKNPIGYWNGKKRSLSTRRKISKSLKNRSKKA